MSNNLIYDIAFSIDQSITLFEKKGLLDKYGTAEEILKLKTSEMKRILNRGWTGNNYFPEEFIKEAERMLPFMEKSGIKTLRFDSPDIPEGLKHLPDYPYLLYYKGALDFTMNRSIAIVGTRKPNEEGIERTKLFTKYLTERGFTIISGLAEGIDGHAHFYCLESEGKTIGVLGCGIDRVYPKSNKTLARMLLDRGGAIISEYPPGFAPRKWYFPQRNRLIVGLSRAVLVIQAPAKSGSKISGQLTQDYNRDLFVVTPGDNELDAGNRELIEGTNGEVGFATAVSRPEELLSHFNY